MERYEIRPEFPRAGLQAVEKNCKILKLINQKRGEYLLLTARFVSDL